MKITNIASLRRSALGSGRSVGLGPVSSPAERRAPSDPGKHDLAESSEPALQGPEPLLGQPELIQLILQGAAGIELVPQGTEQPTVPLVGREIVADGGEVEDGDGEALLSEADGGVDHQGALADLAGGEHVAELSGQQPLVQLPIGLALGVGRSIRAQGAAGDVEGGRRECHPDAAPSPP
jgi:hypothetical protein